ncbi:MAG: hypothetical protein ACOX43_09050 [Bacilli bacterium]
MKKKRGGKNMRVVKTTINLKPENRNKLNELLEENIISSITDGFNKAIELFYKEKDF